MKNFTIICLLGIVLFVTLGFGACSAKSPGLSLSYQNDQAAQETARVVAHENGLTERARIEADARIEQAKVNAGNVPIIVLAILLGTLGLGTMVVIVELRKHPSQAQTTAIVYMPQPLQTYQPKYAEEYRPSWQLPGETEPQEIVIHRKQRA